MDPSETSPLERMQALGRAMDLYRAWREDPAGVSAEDLQQQHPDLAELLEPLLEPECDMGAAEDARETLGAYQIEEEIGRGGMGVVYRALDSKLGRRVALKVLAPHLLGDNRSLARFRREAATVAALHHPGIVEVHGVGEHEGRWFYAMALVDGAPMDRVIASLRDRPDRSGSTVGSVVESLSPSDRVDPSTGTHSGASPFSGSHADCMVALGIQLCEAVAHAHAAGVLHRDIKPANVLLTRHGQVVLTDFGLARAGDAPSVTVTGQFAGSPYYVSPEQARGDWHNVGPAADVFSLGSTLFEMLLLQRPFEASSAQEVLDRIRAPEPVPATEMRARLPKDLAAILSKALEKNPGERYPSAGELAADLRAHAEMRPVSARSRGPLRRLGRWARREPVGALLATSLAVGIPTVVGLGGYLLAKGPVIEAGEAERAYQDRRVRLGEAYTVLTQNPYGGNAPELFRALLEERPDDLDAAIGVLLYAMRQPDGEYGSTMRETAVALGVDPNAHPVLAAMMVDDASRGVPASAAGPEGFHAVGLYNYMIGRGLGDRGRVERGLAQLQQSVLLAPRPVEIYLSSLAHCAFELGDEDCLDRAARALKFHFPDSLHSVTTRAYVLSKLRPQEAMAAAEAAFKAAPLGRISATRVAALKSEAGDRDGARALYLGVLERHPDDSIALSNLCHMAIQDGDLEGAKGWIATFEEFRPGDPSVLRAKARLAMVNEDFPLAEALLTELRGVDVWNVVDATDLAMSLIRQSKGAEAQKVCADALARHPNEERLVIRLVQSVQSESGAEPALKRLDAMAFKSASTMALRGSLLAMLSRYPEAVEELEASERLEPLASGQCRNLVICLRELEREDDAFARCKEYVKQYPGDRQLHGQMLDLLFRREDGAGVVAEALRLANHLASEGQLDPAIEVLDGMTPLPGPAAVPAASAKEFMGRLTELRELKAAGAEAGR